MTNMLKTCIQKQIQVKAPAEHLENLVSMESVTKPLAPESSKTKNKLREDPNTLARQSRSGGPAMVTM